MKAYLAGPDVFRPDALRWADEARALCRAHGVEPLVPLDGDARDAAAIYAQNIALIRAADVVLANLSPFRGAEPDSGTAFEVGFAVALGKPVIGYLEQLSSLPERVAAWQGVALQQTANGQFDRDGWLVEDFGLHANLMLAVPARMVPGGLLGALQALAV